MKNSYGILLCSVGTPPLLVQGAPLPHSDAGAIGYEVYLPMALSLCSLVALVVLLVKCVTCCKGQEINFKEFEDHFEDDLDFTPPAEDTPSMHSNTEVYTLAVPSVSLLGPPQRQLLTTTQGPTGFQVARQCLSYIQEIGSGWFGKVLLSEIYTDPGVVRVVVKELKANASAKEQNDFLQQADPYRVLQHPNILQCLAQCMEVIPFLSVFEYCELVVMQACRWYSLIQLEQASFTAHFPHPALALIPAL
ncbi:serine/threonine-protein kinase LMTK2 isoform X1 [Arapaima gigas]